MDPRATVRTLSTAPVEISFIAMDSPNSPKGPIFGQRARAPKSPGKISPTAQELASKMGPDDIILKGYSEMATYRALMAYMADEKEPRDLEVPLDGGNPESRQNVMATKRRASDELENPSKVIKLGERTSHVFTNTSSGRQDVNSGGGTQYVAENMQFHKYQGDHGGEHFECLKDLLWTDPRVDKNVIEDTKGIPLRESYKHILDNSDFDRWRNDLRSGLFWISGSPGKGKTMLLCGIIDMLGEEAPESPPSYFFCQKNDSELNSATAVLRGLIYLLAINRRPLLELLQKRYNFTGGKLFDKRDTFFALAGIFKSMLQLPTTTPTAPIYFIVDALDECRTDLEKLLCLIRQTSMTESTCVKWIVSGRIQQDIVEGLKLAQQKTLLDLDRNEASVSTAVNTFIEYQVSQLTKQKSYSPQLQRTVREYLQNNADDTFLWVSLVCQSLSKIAAWKTPNKLRAFPPGLQSFYGEMLNQMLGRTDEDDLNTCRAILAVTLVVYRPVTLAELPFLVELPAELHDNPEWLEELIKICAREYLETNAGAEIFSSQPATEHYRIFSRSLRILMETLEPDICKQRDPGVSVDQIETNEDPLEAVRYSCTHWVNHLAEAAVDRQKHPQDLKPGGLLHQFLQRFLLCWLEALSLIQRISDSVVAITRLETVLKGINAEPEMLTLVKDARRFILQNRCLIEDTPLQAYTSALLFSPARSIIRMAFEKDEPAWISTKPVVEDYWGACLQTLKGHGDWVTSVALSHDNSWFASASSDRSIKIWNAATGKCERTLEGHGSCVNSLVFSHDGQYLASASSDKTVKLWNAQRWKYIGTFEGHGGSVNSALFTHDSKKLISASSDRTVRIWDIAGKDIRTLQGHSDWVNEVAYAGGGNRSRLASASSDRTIRIWDIDKGVTLRVLRGHGDWVSSVTFQPDSAGTLLASASYDQTVKLWDVETGTCVRTFEGHSDWVRSVAFSHNGRRLASASDDASIRIWATAGEDQQILQGHGAPVTSLLFTPSGEHLISASQDRSLKLWDTTLGTQALEIHQSRVDLVVFSPDGRHIASVSDDQTIKIWNTTTGECLQTLEGHCETLNSAVFSPSGRTIASASSDRTVKIWDVTTGRCIQTLEGHNDWVEPIVFSPDGNRLVSASGDKTVKVWDVAAGACLQTLTGHRHGVRSVIFSHDGKHVASGSTDHTARVWDAATGKCTQVLDGHGDLVTSVVFSNDDKYVASSSADGTIRIWTLGVSECHQILTGHADLVHAICFSHDARFLASTAADGSIKIWVAATGECVRTIDVGIPLKRISFDLSDRDACLLTEIGRLELASLEPANSAAAHTREDTWYGYGVSSDLLWVTCHGRDVLRLPSEYGVACSAVYRSTVAIGCESGRVLVLGFTPNQFPTLKTRGGYRVDGGKGRQQTLTAPVDLDDPPPPAAPTPLLFQDATFVSEPEGLTPQRENASRLSVPGPEELVTPKLLGGLGVDPDTGNASSRTLLFHAMKQGDRDTALSLAQQRWNIPEETVMDHLDNPTDEHKAQSLFDAIKRQREDEIGFLIEIGADLEATGYGDWPGWKGTALHEAAWYGTPSIIQLLLRNGADKNARDIGGRTPAFRPNWSRTDEIAKVLS
ncbi:hypothetical protein DL768_011146 [Monosporascus sp. mg162]|nr:hypothetical protein DL768_011146 [Monosporascus sp. mg162]